MLRKFRIILAGLFFVGITLLFVGIGHDWWGWMAKLQFLPAMIRVVGGATLANVLLFCLLLGLTLLFGRIYCSVICPLGLFQDAVIWIRRKLWPKRRFTFSPERRIVRLGVFALVVVSFFTSGQILISLIAPYSAYGRIVRSIVSLAGGTPVPALLVVGGVTLLVVAICAVLWGRAWCNTICPVGTLLGYISKNSLFKIRIDEAKCVSCTKCARDCKASCIDVKNHSIDYSRCVDCFDCIGNCSTGAISFSATEKGKTSVGNEHSSSDAAPDNGRRRFLAVSALAAGTALAAHSQEKAGARGLLPLEPKTAASPSCPLVPPGAPSVEKFFSRCTSCQLCVSACPNKVLRPSTDLKHLLQPLRGFENGWCRPECTACSDVCPTGAILPMPEGGKLSVKAGTAKLDASLCLAAKGEERCGNCARHCPVGAIAMVRVEGQKGRRPAVMEDMCIGCGACEYLCPVRPLSAIRVDGIAVHHKLD